MPARINRRMGFKGMRNIKHFEKRLQDRLEELDNRLRGIEEDLDEPQSPDTEERATEREGDEVLESLGKRGLTEIRMIEAALSRVEDGTFGMCVSCGKPISNERLELLPHTPKCKSCA